jgi:16S rRNA (guanine966-N2)-methyltransferase
MKQKPAGVVRIIGGRWRGTRLPVPDVPGLRPSGDRSRETLFNWLQAHIRGARCADLFAGSGALGLEAASRGACSVVLIEQSELAARHLRKAVERLDADIVECVHGDALGWLSEAGTGSLDLVFLDPPFGSGLDTRAIALIDQRGIVAEGGFVYLESPRDQPATVPPSGWDTWREKMLGEVRMQLFRKI